MNGKKVMRGTILTALVMAFMLYLSSAAAMASFWVVVKSNNTNVRNAASTDSEVMTVVNAGDRLSVVSEEQGADGKTWYKVSINNVSGYVRSDTVNKEGEANAAASVTEEPASDVQPVEASSSATVTSMPSQAATVKTDNVNVRSGASTGGDVVAKLASGAAVTLTGTTTDSSGKTWYQVNFINNGSNVTGFIREDFVEPGEIVEPEAPAEEVPEGEGDADLAEIYGDMPAENEPANNDYELFFEADSEGVDCWYVHDNIAQKRYKLEQLMRADEMNVHNVEIRDEEIRRLKIVLIVLAVLFVLALAAAAFFGFKYHDARDDDDDDDEDDDDDDVRVAPSVRRRERPATGSVMGRNEAGHSARRREPSREDARGERGTVRRSEAGAQRKPGTVQRRPSGEEVRTRSAQAGRVSPDGERVRRPSSGSGAARSPQPGAQVRRTRVSSDGETVKKSSRPDVEWKSKNFLKEEEDLDFSFINGDDEE